MGKKSLFLFYGEDTYSSLQKLKIWKDAFIQKYGGVTNLETLDAKEISAQKFLVDIETLPFMSEKRLIILKDFLSRGKKSEQEKIAEKLKAPPEFCVLVFHESKMPDKRTKLFKTLARHGQLEEFPELKPNQIISWILAESHKRQIKISFATASFLAQYSSAKLWHLSNELDKLKTFAGDAEISREMIITLTPPSLSTTIFNLTDALAERKSSRSLKTLSELHASGEDLNKVFYLIARHFRILIQVKELSQESGQNVAQDVVQNVARQLKIHPFVAEKTLKQAKNFNFEELIKIHGELLEIDTKQKTGIIKISNPKTGILLALETLILNLCKAR